MATRKHTRNAPPAYPDHLFAVPILDYFSAYRGMPAEVRSNILSMSSVHRQGLLDDLPEPQGRLDVQAYTKLRTAVSEVEAHELITRIRSDVRAGGTRGGEAQ